MAQSKLAIIGAGPIGCVESIYLKKKGFNVEIYEIREDMRGQHQDQGRSINITLSERGIRCLRKIGIEKEILDKSVKVHSRMIHNWNGDITTQPYGKNGECLFSINRSHVNKLLLEEVEKNHKITIHFEHEITEINIHDKKLTFRRSADQSRVMNSTKVDFIIGCDGVNSVVRERMKVDGILEYQRVEIEHQYKELLMPSTPEGEHKIDPNYLHVWPRGESVLIGLPNKNGTFTMSLFMPKKEFDSIEDGVALISLFESFFPDVLDMISRTKLVADFFKHPTGRLVSLQCSHYAADGVLLLGDAAHAVVPFYGQGTNAGFEDCLLLDELLEDASNEIGKASLHFSEVRRPDMLALAEMSLDHYDVLCKKVNNPLYRHQRRLEDHFSTIMPYFVPTYTMVAFTYMPYSQVRKKSQCQIAFINDFLFLVSLLENIFFALAELYERKLHNTITA